MKMRPSLVLEKLRRGEIASCIKLNMADARTAHVAALNGFDCVWMDMEHTSNTLEQTENQVRAVHVEGVDTLVRPARGSYSDLIWPLEMDASGIMVPHVRTAAEAEEIVRRTRFKPVGERYIDGGNADGRYANIPIADYVQQANEQRFIVLQIEDPEGMDNLDQIAAVPGYDMLFYGAGDYSHALGVVGQMDHPKVREGRRLIGEAANRHGKVAGLISVAPDDVKDAIACGYRFISLGADVIALNEYFSAQHAMFRDIVGG